MSTTNYSQEESMEILLNGFPGLHELHHWIWIPFFILFLVASVGNLTVLLVIVREQSLHEPMYYFISMLSSVNLFTDIILLPQALVVLWFGPYSINFDACFVQMFCIYFTAGMESTVLVLMAYDRYIAVCKPLRYSSLVTNVFVFKGCFLAAVRSFCVVLPIPILARMLPYCSTTIVNNVYCEYFAVISAVCVQAITSVSYFFILLALVGIPDASIIGLSYYMIVRTALKLKSREARWKIFSTCSSHALVIISFYLLGLLSIILGLVEDRIPGYIRVLCSALFITVPPTLNPLIYGIRTKDIWTVIVKLFKNNLTYF
ncbi:olfactory receptor 52E8-like [Protopterus annectens]|uniref:olfactory receptor 52E8-like n=1 Tax=Protopterus annectens TaxID=7888 RepID=UPI001CFB1E27|nr:olfactory receptor 52E8-like [Protopterus annectens]